MTMSFLVRGSGESSGQWEHAPVVGLVTWLASDIEASFVRLSLLLDTGELDQARHELGHARRMVTDMIELRGGLELRSGRGSSGRPGAFDLAYDESRLDEATG
jgi:hypothetical protein